MFVKDSGLFNKSLKIQDGWQSCPVYSAIKRYSIISNFETIYTVSNMLKQIIANLCVGVGLQDT